MDLTHSGWSDIFFLGMDFPEGARVINVSVDLTVREPGHSSTPRPPVEAYLRVIDEPVIRLVSVDLKASADITTVRELFDFARDYLGLLKAAVIAAGVVPPGMEGLNAPISQVLQRASPAALSGASRSSAKSTTSPKGSRLAVSTNLLASLITVCMRATGQIRSLEGGLEESDRRLVAARAILGEWLAGSGGGWQDSGGVWPGIKLIHGVAASEGDPEFGISRGLPAAPATSSSATMSRPPRRAKNLQQSLVLVHGGMAQDVGPHPGDGHRALLTAVSPRMAGPRRSHPTCSTRSSATFAPATSRASAAPPRGISRVRFPPSSPGRLTITRRP